jgi:hypothetical protein
MDASELTRLLDEAYPDGVTWETHLAFVDRLTDWDDERLLDFQESLFSHFVEGTWTLSWGAPGVEVPSGHVVNGLNVESEIARLRTTIETFSGIVSEEPFLTDIVGRSQADLDALLAVGAPEISRVRPAPGVVGIPVLDPFIESIAKAQIARGGKPTRRRVLDLANQEWMSNARDLARVLRAAAWAVHRETGTRVRGLLPSREEEAFSSGGERLFRVVHVLQRDADRIEAVYRWMAPTSEYLLARLGSLTPLTRALSARVVGPAQVTDVGPHDGGPVPFGTILDEWPTQPEPANTLLRDARALLSGESSRRLVAPMEQDRFWSLIDLLEGRADHADRLISALTKLPVADIHGFAEALADALYALDRPELTKDPGDPDQLPMSDDVFLYFRCSVVAGGRAGFERVSREGVLREREWDDEGAGELLLGVVPAAIERRTGREWDGGTHVSYETGSNQEAWGNHRAPQSRGWEGWVAVRSRSRGPEGEFDTVRKWRTSDKGEAAALQLEAEHARAERTGIRIVDDLRISSRLSSGLIGAPVDWVRSAPSRS